MHRQDFATEKVVVNWLSMPASATGRGCSVIGCDRPDKAEDCRP